MVNDMNFQPLIPVLLVAALSGCASTGKLASNDPVRARKLAEIERAKADGSHPLNESQYVYPNSAASQKAP
jgi:hypothetical protein